MLLFYYSCFRARDVFFTCKPQLLKEMLFGVYNIIRAHPRWKTASRRLSICRRGKQCPRSLMCKKTLRKFLTPSFCGETQLRQQKVFTHFFFFFFFDCTSSLVNFFFLRTKNELAINRWTERRPSRLKKKVNYCVSCRAFSRKLSFLEYYSLLFFFNSRPKSILTSRASIS